MDLVCRTCLNIIKDDSLYTHINQSNPSEREKLEACVPEMTLDIVLEPLICNGCKESLSIAFSFKKQCMETEKALFSYIQGRRHNENCTNLLSNCDLLTLVKNDVILEHNYSTCKKPENYIRSIGDESPADLQAFIKATLSSLTAEVARQKSDRDEDEVIFDIVENVVNHETVDGCTKIDPCTTIDPVEEDAKQPQVRCVRSSLRSKTIPNILRRKYCTRQQPNDVGQKVTEGNKENVGKRCTKCNKGVRCKCNSNSRTKSHSCPTCHKSFLQEKNLKAHRLTHERRRKFQCSSCKRCFVSQSSLERHLKVHELQEKSDPPDEVLESPHECPKCRKRFSSDRTLEIHERTHDDNPYQCHGCKRFFQDLSMYRRHVSRFLPKCVEGRRLYRSEQTVKSSKSQSTASEDINEINREIAADDLAKRMKLRRLKYFCKVCYKGFTTNFSRNRHVKFQHWSLRKNEEETK